MTLGPIQLRDKVLRNIAAQGQVGASWLEALPSLLRRLEVEWGIKVGRPFPNATEAFVSEAVTADGQQVALKIPIAGRAQADRELSLLQTANGRGYVRFLRDDGSSGAMLLERLGPAAGDPRSSNRRADQDHLPDIAARLDAAAARREIPDRCREGLGNVIVHFNGLAEARATLLGKGHRGRVSVR